MLFVISSLFFIFLQFDFFFLVRPRMQSDGFFSSFCSEPMEHRWSSFDPPSSRAVYENVGAQFYEPPIEYWD